MSDCVGFVECPCADCRIRRVQATAAHGQHERDEYCGACRTDDKLTNLVPR